MSDALSHFTHQFLSYGQDMHAIEDAADRAPSDPALNTWAAAASLFGQTPDGIEKARPYLARAQANGGGTLTDAIAAWARGDQHGAVERLDAHLEVTPHDLAAGRLAQILLLDRGDTAGMLAVTQRLTRHHPNNHYVLGQHAFALEQAGRLDCAEAAARKAVARADAPDPWSHHAMAHVLHTRGKVREGVDWITRHDTLWDRSNAFMQVHAWWHAALHHIDDDDLAAALRIYDDRIAAACSTCVQGLVASVSLLARLKLRGLDVDARLRALGDRLAERVHDRANGFLDLHYLYGLALAGRDEDAATMLAALAWTAAGAGARGLHAHADGRAVEAAEWLGLAAPTFHELGGSHEQRDLYELVELDAALKADRRDQAARLLARRVAARPQVAWQRKMLRDLMAEATPG